MPPLEQWERVEALTLFPYAGRDGYGHIIHGTAVEVTGRWVDVQLEVSAPDSATISINARVVLDRDIHVGSLLWHGALASYQDGTGTASNELTEVRQVTTVRDIKNRATRWEALCSRYTQKDDVV